MNPRTLYLLRHAKSSWEDPGLADFDRPLAPRGRRAGATIAGHLRERAVSPELVLCSPALRTRQTLELVATGFDPGSGATVELEPSLYGASAEDLLAALREVPDDVGSVLLVAHQPGIQDLALLLTAAGAGAELERLRAKYPTAALATFSVPGPWRRLEAGSARLEGFVKPKEIEPRP